MNTIDNQDLTAIDQSELDAFVQKRLEEEKAKRTDTSIKLESLRVIGNLLIIFVLGLFIVSPFVQLVLRVINGLDSQPLMVNSSYVRYYQWTIGNINHVARFTAVVVLIWLIMYGVLRKRSGKLLINKPDIKEIVIRLFPMIVFIMFAISIALVTIIRGPNKYDLTGHPYMFESIYSYISYPMVFFFCGMTLFREKHRRILLYALLFTSLPVNILALVNEWITKTDLFKGAGICAVFHNSNHYGYYLAITIITAALLFVHEKTVWLKVVSAICAAVATIVLIMNNTLGAYLAVLFVLILFVLYSFFRSKTHRKQSIIILGAFLFITLVMSFFYSTIMSSFLTLFGDLGLIIKDPLEADSAGSSRWKLWKGTVQHMGESPILGFGVEGLLNTYGVGTPHNEFLQYAEFFGIQTSLLYIIACAVVLIRVFRNSKSMDNTTMICFFVCIGYLASSFFGVAIYYTTPFIYIFLGLTYAEYLRKGSSQSNKTD